MRTRGQEMRLAPNLVLPPEVVTAKLAILANSGAGKSYTGLKLAELMLSVLAQIVVMDPVGIWWGLLSGANGKGPGFQVLILGGAHGHMPLSHKAGAAVAAFIVESGLSVVLDMSDMLPDELHEFVTDFSRAMLRERRKKPAPMHIFWEEADNFSPQRMKGSSSYSMVLAVAKLLKEGRHAGIGWTLISQRSQDVDKVVLDLAETLIALRTGKGWKRVKEWLDEKEVEIRPELKKELAGMDTGDAIVVSPFLLKATYLRIHVEKRTTFDSSKTPELGEARVTPTLAEVDLSKIRAAMTEVMGRIEGDDPKALKRRVVELERELAAAVVQTPVSALIAPAPSWPKPTPVKDLEQLRDDVEGMGLHLQALAQLGDELIEKIREVVAPTRKLSNHALTMLLALGGEIARLKGPLPYDPQAPKVESTHQKAMRKVSSMRSGLSLCAERILYALHWKGPDGEMDRRQLGVLSVYRVSGNFNNALSELRGHGLLDEASRSVKLSGAGRQKALEAWQAAVGPGGMEELRAEWREKLSGTAAKLYDVLVTQYPKKVSREELARLTGYEVSGNFNNAISELNGGNLIEKEKSGRGTIIGASPYLFELK